MAKIYGIGGLMTGKLGGNVFAIRNGVQIARIYNPSPSDSKTDAQVAARAKLKLLSQLSAAVAPVIAIPRRGLVSGRNTFTKVNYDYVGYANGTAEIPMADIQLTNGNAGLAGIQADRSSGTSIEVSLMENVANTYDRVVYVVLRKDDSQRISPATSLVVESAGVDGVFPATLDYVEGDISVHAYGVRLNTTASRVAFGNLTAPRAEDVAKLITNRTYQEGDMSLSVTRGLYLYSNETHQETSGVSMVTIRAIAYNRTSSAILAAQVSGAGRVERGSQVTLVAPTVEGDTFRGWAESENGVIISANSNYILTADSSVTLYAIYETVDDRVAVNAVVASISQGRGTVSGSGRYAVGSPVTLVATPSQSSSSFERIVFRGWVLKNEDQDPETNQYVSREASYTFNAPENDMTLYAIFAVESVD